MSNQNWDPEKYAKDASFVPLLGNALIELLDPKPGEKILDLGCGNGTMTKQLADFGCDVTGADASPEMVVAAKALGLNAIVVDAEHLHIDGEYDAVISNSMLHWTSNHYAVIRGVWKALKPGGRFALECGGEGCLRIIREGIKIALIKRGIDYKARNPWKYPVLGTTQDILENQGFKVSYIARIDRPTPLKTSLRDWLAVFTNSHTQGFSEEEEKESFYSEVEEYCKPMLYKDGVWTADYVRLRFLAKKPLDAE